MLLYRRRLRRQAKDANGGTYRAEGNLAEQRNVLRSRIRGWEQLQAIYMPGLLQHRHNLSTQRPSTPLSSGNPEDLELWLPSALPLEDRERICIKGLPGAEEKLRTAQCYDALESMRHILTIKARMIQFKNKNLRGQREGTRSRAVIDRVHVRARAAADKYRAARKAKLLLAGRGDWETTLQVLNDNDIRSYQDPNRLRPRRRRRGVLEDDQLAGLQEQDILDDDTSNNQQEMSNITLFNDDRTRRDGTGETRRTISWIWLNHSLSEDVGNEMLRSEWAKSRARAARAQEEVMLLNEEMRRTLESLSWEAEDWKTRAVKRTEQVLEAGLKDGLRAYAMRQSNIQTSLATHFRSLWEAPLTNQAENIDTTMPPTSVDDNSGKADDDDINEDEDEGLGPDATEGAYYQGDDE